MRGSRALHDSEDDVGLVADGGEGYGSNHHDHEVECLHSD